MNRYTFSAQSGKAYYCNSILGFINDQPTDIVGQLVKHAFEINKEQSDAWEIRFANFKSVLKSVKWRAISSLSMILFDSGSVLM